jgi:hypothetical protein
MKHCPVCHATIDDAALVCGNCLAKAQGLTTRLNRQHLFLAAHQITLFFAVFLFAKGAWMAFSETGYSQFVESMGLPPVDPTVHYIGALFASISAMLYAIAWTGGTVRARWGYPVCVVALVVFVVGQVVTRIAAVGPQFPLVQAVAFIVLWSTLPVFQIIGLRIGEDPNGPAAGAASDSANAG